MCAIIEIVLEVFVILIYAVVFYRFITKRRLAKSMDRRDKARSDLYLANLRTQSAPNTPGFGLPPQTPKSPWVAAQAQDPYSSAENGERGGSTVQYATPVSPARPQPSFQLQPPPNRAQRLSPKTPQGEWSTGPAAPAVPPTPAAPSTSIPIPAAPSSRPAYQVMGPAPGEQEYPRIPLP